MIFILCALQCEAKPIIEFFNLSNYRSDSPFKIYTNKNIWLIISGVGMLNAISAVSYLYVKAGEPKYHAWINIGIAGSKTLPLGTFSLIHKVTEETSNKSFYPMFIFDAKSYLQNSLITKLSPNFNYHPSSLYDMEAYGFYFSASKYTNMEFIHCLKIISDNEEFHSLILEKEKVENLIKNNIYNIENIINEIKKTLSKYEQTYALPKEFMMLEKKYHFTETQKYKLLRLIQKWKALFPQEVLNQNFQSSRDIFNYFLKKISIKFEGWS